MKLFIGKRQLNEIPPLEFLLLFIQAFAFALIALVVVVARHYESTVYIFSLYAESILFGGGGLYVIAVILDSINTKLEKYGAPIRVALWFMMPLVLFAVDILIPLLRVGVHY